MGIMGSSTIFAIIISPLSIFHILFNLYVCLSFVFLLLSLATLANEYRLLQTEYFGSPIGVWKVRSKMFYTFTELIFMYVYLILHILSKISLTKMSSTQTAVSGLVFSHWLLMTYSHRPLDVQIIPRMLVIDRLQLALLARMVH